MLVCSVLGRKSMGCGERLRDGVRLYEWVDVEGERRRRVVLWCLEWR